MTKVIGTVTTYVGSELDYLRGFKVRILAVMKGAASPDYHPDSGSTYLFDDDEIARTGGITAEDRVEVQPWIRHRGSFSFVTSDPRAVDLRCFEHLTTESHPK